MKKSLLFFALLLFVSLLGWSQETITIAVPKNVSSLPLYELEGRLIGGFKVQIVSFDDHALALAQLIQGKTKFLATGFSQGYYHGVESKDIQHVSTFVWGVSSLMAIDPQLKTLKDFQGKTILVPFAKSPLDLQLRALVASQGLEGKVKIQYAPIPQQVALLHQDKADGIAIPEPLVSKLVSQQQASIVFTFASAWKDLTGDPRSPAVSLFSTSQFLAGPGAVVARELRKALTQSVANINKSPEAMVKKYAAFFAITPETLKMAMENTLLDSPSESKSRDLISMYLEKTGDKKPLNTELFFE